MIVVVGPVVGTSGVTVRVDLEAVGGGEDGDIRIGIWDASTGGGLSADPVVDWIAVVVVVDVVLMSVVEVESISATFPVLEAIMEPADRRGLSMYPGARRISSAINPRTNWRGWSSWPPFTKPVTTPHAVSRSDPSTDKRTPSRPVGAK